MFRNLSQIHRKQVVQTNFQYWVFCSKGQFYEPKTQHFLTFVHFSLFLN